MTKRIDQAIADGPEAIERELARQEAIYAEQLSRYQSTRARARFAVAAHMTKTRRKVGQLQNARNRFPV